jgi:imidazolonepropionase-like amidohydrolase
MLSIGISGGFPRNTQLAKEKELGAVATGYFADLVAVDGDPLADINVVLNNVKWVLKGGTVVVNKFGR